MYRGSLVRLTSSTFTDESSGLGGGDRPRSPVYAVGDDMILTWAACEAGFVIIRTDLNGKKLWGSKHNALDLASDGERLFVTGDIGYEGMHGVKVFAVKDCRPLNWGNGKLILDRLYGNIQDLGYFAVFETVLFGQFEDHFTFWR